MLAACAASLAYIFSSAKWEQKFSFFMFLLSFSPIFKFDVEQTSLFMVLRIAVIISYIFQQKGKFGFTFITVVIAFFTYITVVSEIFDTDYLTHAINIVLWVLVSYVLIKTVSSHKTTPILRSLVNGVIITGIIGLFLDDIPQLKDIVKTAVLIAEDGVAVSRYSAFWNDPNVFTVILNASLWFTYLEFNKKKINTVEFILRSTAVSFLGLMTMSKSCVLLLAAFWLYLLISKNNIKTIPKICVLFVSVIALFVFVYKNPYWFSDIIYRFTSGNSEVTADVVTTGRSRLWAAYAESMLEDLSWIYGHGLNSTAIEINGVFRGSHNILIQSLFQLGVMGTIIYIYLIYHIYHSGKDENFKLNVNKNETRPAGYSLLAIIVSMMFLDGMFSEMLYYLLAISFIYMNSTNPQQFSENGEYEVLNEKD